MYKRQTLFFVPAMNLAGIPPFSGFLGKVGLIQAGVVVGTPLAWALVAGSVVTSLLTLYAMAKAWNRAFWGDPAALVRPEPDEEPDEDGDADGGPRLPQVMVGATVGLIAVSLAMTALAGPLYAFPDGAAATLLSPAYTDAVLTGGRA